MNIKYTLALLSITACSYLTCHSLSARHDSSDTHEPGTVINTETVNRNGIDSYFTSSEINDKIFDRISGKSFGADCTTPRTSLRYITVLHVDIDGNTRLGEMICHKSISDDLLDIFRNLYNAGYPIERMVLIDEYNADDEASMSANNSSSFNFRRISGSKKLSKHSRGMAVDINPLYNPYVRTRPDGKKSIAPKSGKPYADRSATFPYKIQKGDLCYNEFIRHGFRWGGDWRKSKDYQHFEK